jgi:4-amino-4-deoxy-L-arabinose transferase-like glycosyltransferase
VAASPAAWGRPVAILLAAAVFRALPLLENRFHPDEALYAYFGRLIASGRDVLLAQVVVDKPPLPFYLLAGGFALFGPGEFAARLPAYFASLISVALVFALARRLYGAPTAHLAAAAMALSPFGILFAITLFIDPLLTAGLLWGLWMSRSGRAWPAAIAFALAFTAKQTALVFIPLALALVPVPPRARPAEAAGIYRRHLVRLAAALLIAGVIIFGWDALRQAFGAPVGFWEQGYGDNVPNRLVRSGEAPLRALAWMDVLSHVTASAPLNALLALGGPALVVAGWRRPSRAALADLALTGFLALYLAVYWLLPFNVWDRYLVPVAPLVLILLARIITRAADLVRPPTSLLGGAAIARGLLALAACALLLPSAITAARSGFPIGGDHGAYDGIDDAAGFVHGLPEGAVLYDFWLSWQWNYYLFDSPVYVAWMPSPQALAGDLRAFGRASPRYLVVPSWESDAEARAAAHEASFAFLPLHESFRRDGSRSFVVYQLVPASP